MGVVPIRARKASVSAINAIGAPSAVTAGDAASDTGTPFASNGVAEATGDVVALRIIAMARLGELDCDCLREGALRHLAEMKQTATQPRGD